MLLLCDELRKFIEKQIEQLPVQKKDSGQSPPKVLVGWLPPKTAGAKDTDDYPFIRILPLNGEDNNGPMGGEGQCTLSILVGCWAEDPEGWRDSVNLMQRIRLALLALPGQTLANRYRIAEQENSRIVEWRVFEDQPYPQWLAEIKVTFHVPVVTSNIEEAIHE